MGGQGIHRPQSAQHWHDLYKEQCAHVEALAGALLNTADGIGAICSVYTAQPGGIRDQLKRYEKAARAALARLPADALKERRALEACAVQLRALLDESIPDWDKACAALAALDAAQRKP